jgi:CRP-like cAMP-binding protein
LKEIKQILEKHFGKLSTQELEIIQPYFKEEQFLKNDFFTLSGKKCDRLSFIKSGMFRIFTTSDGKEVTQWISTENHLITEVMGFFFNKPNRWNIQALVDTSLITIHKQNYLKLCREFPKWNSLEKDFIVKCFVTLEDRVFSHISMTAEERYDLYHGQNKALFNQVPLQYIASILGMSAETLSRIRNRKRTSS